MTYGTTMHVAITAQAANTHASLPLLAKLGSLAVTSAVEGEAPCIPSPSLRGETEHARKNRRTHILRDRDISIHVI